MMRKFSLHQAACGLMLLLVLTATNSARAGSFQVGPVTATLSNDHPVSALTVRNTGSTATVVQLEVMTWAQQAGNDSYAPTSDILATPPIFTVPAGASQVIRVGLRRPFDATDEQAYRLFLREVPPPPKPGFKGMRLALQISMPVFVVPAAVRTPELHWQAERTAAGKLQITLANQGPVHVRLIGLKLVMAGEPIPLPAQPVYVLTGTTHHWLIETKTAIPIGSTLHLTAQSGAEPVQANLLVSGR